MQKFLSLLLLFCSPLIHAQESYNPFYNNFYYGGNVDLKTGNMLQVNATTYNRENSLDLSYIHQTQNEKWQFGAKFNRFNRSADVAELMVRRQIFQINDRRLYLTGGVSHLLRNSFDDYKYYSYSQAYLATNYVGKWIEIGAKYDYYSAYLSPNGVQKTWYQSSHISGYIGMRNQIKSAELKTRISGNVNLDQTPMVSQQLYLKSGLNFGYAIGMHKAFNANIGYRKNNFEFNLSYGNRNQKEAPLPFKNLTYLKTGILFHL